MFEAPIPGQSLTNEPKNYPWENAARLNTPEDAIVYHLERLNQPKRAEAMLDFLQLDIDVVTMTEGILRNAVANGEHSVDVSMIIAPIIHEHIVGLADATGIDYDEGLDEDDTQEERAYAIRENKARKILRDIKMDKKPDLGDLEASMPKTSIRDTKVEDMPEEKPMGLMARPQGVM
jgi:hypothetical protein|tara:strand:- start:1348 stop:1878 length:531 start_codon:yes stop_codon:yes gene_type:complete